MHLYWDELPSHLFSARFSLILSPFAPGNIQYNVFSEIVILFATIIPLTAIALVSMQNVQIRRMLLRLALIILIVMSAIVNLFLMFSPMLLSDGNLHSNINFDVAFWLRVIVNVVVIGMLLTCIPLVLRNMRAASRQKQAKMNDPEMMLEKPPLLTQKQ